MKNIGILLVFLGLILAIYAFFIFDVSIKTNYNSAGLPSKIVNFALMEKRQNYIYGSIILILVGFGLVLFDLLKNKGNSEVKEPKESEKITTKWVLSTIGWIVLYTSIFIVLFLCYIHYWSV